MNKLRNFLSILVLVPVLALALAACGGSGIDKGALQDMIKSRTNLQLLGTGTRVVSVTCAGDGPFSCVALLNDGEQAFFTATCGSDGVCAWRPS